MSFSVSASPGLTAIAVVTNASTAGNVSVSFGSTVLLDNEPIPAGYKATAVPFFYVYEPGNFTIDGIAPEEFVTVVSGQ